MWIQCTVNKLLPLREGTSRDGAPYKVIDLELDWLDLDAQGKPVADSHGHYVHSTVRVSALNTLADVIVSRQIQQGHTIWAELHFYTQIYEDRNGNFSTSNKIRLVNIQ